MRRASGSTRRGCRGSTSRRRPRSQELRPYRSCSRCRRYPANPRRPSDPNKPRRRACRGAGPGRTAESRRPSAPRRRVSRRIRSGCSRYGRRSGRRVERIDGDLLTCLRAERAFLGDACVRLPVAGELVAAAFGTGDLDRRGPEPGAPGAATECSGLVKERVHDARGEARLVSCCRDPSELDVEGVTEHRIRNGRAARSQLRNRFCREE